MKRQRLHRIAILVVSLLLTLPGAATADLYWDADYMLDAKITEGDGSWGNGSSNWWDATVPGNTTWSNLSPTVAVFGETTTSGTGTVTVAPGGVVATGLKFNSAYTIQSTAEDPTSVLTLSGTAPEIVANARAKLTGLVANDPATTKIVIRRDDNGTDATYTGYVELYGPNTFSCVVQVGDETGSSELAKQLLLQSPTAVNADCPEFRVMPNSRVWTRASGEYAAPITLQGMGYMTDVPTQFLEGALYFYASAVIWSGDITLKADSAICSRAGTGTANTISGVIQEEGGSRSMTFVSADKASIIALTAPNTYTGNTYITTSIAGFAVALQNDGSTAFGSIAKSPLIDVGANTKFDVTGVTAGFVLGSDSLVPQTLQGNGAVVGNVWVGAGSSVAAGRSVGLLTFNNDLDLSAGGMTWELATLVDPATAIAGTDFDQVSIAGALTLGGTSGLTLDFGLLAEEDRPGYATPDSFWGSDRSWTIVSVDDAAGSLAGNFASVVNGSFSGVGTFTTTVSGNDVVLFFDSDYVPLPPIPGDTNNNRIVDAADAAKLAENWGANVGTGGYANGDFNGDHVVNAADASILAANWGDHTGGESVAGVPEPSTLALILAGLLSLTAARKRRRA